MILAELGTLESFGCPQLALNSLIDFYTSVATDPKTNGGYKLVKIDYSDAPTDTEMLEFSS